MVTTHRSALYDLAAQLYEEAIQGDSLKADSAWVADRFNKSIEIMELMDEKLPSRLAPYNIPVGGDRIGTLYSLLGEATGRPELEEKGREIIRDEILRYGLYLPYYRSLIEHAGGLIVGSQSTLNVNHLNLNAVDRYVPVYLTNLLQSYVNAGGDAKEIDELLVERGVDLDDIVPLVGYRKK